MRIYDKDGSEAFVPLAQSEADAFGILSEVNDPRDNDAPPFNHIENAVRKAVDEQPPVSPMERWRNLSKISNPPKRCIQTPHKHPATARLTRFVELVSGLKVGVGGKKEDKLTHGRDSCRESVVE